MVTTSKGKGYIAAHAKPHMWWHISPELSCNLSVAAGVINMFKGQALNIH